MEGVPKELGFITVVTKEGEMVLKLDDQAIVVYKESPEPGAEIGMIPHRNTCQCLIAMMPSRSPPLSSLGGNTSYQKLDCNKPLD